jgi:peptidoglycan/xylan/chitin deacetylase (PgdA/CDA1 family)
MARYVSFRFDDGFLDGARKAVDCLSPSPASFFVVTGLVCGTHCVEHEKLFEGRNFGSPDQWRAIAALGHDIQPHSITHANFAALNPDQQRWEIQGSLGFVRSLHRGPYIFGFPYNVIPEDLDLASLDLSAAGFRTVDSARPIAFNRLDDDALDLFRLQGWAIRESHFQTVVDQVECLPDRSWAILSLHSFDGEGHEPWSSDGFSRLVEAIRRVDLQIVSIRDMVKKVGRSRTAHDGATEPAARR